MFDFSVADVNDAVSAGGDEEEDGDTVVNATRASHFESILTLARSRGMSERLSAEGGRLSLGAAELERRLPRLGRAGEVGRFELQTAPTDRILNAGRSAGIDGASAAGGEREPAARANKQPRR